MCRKMQSFAWPLAQKSMRCIYVPLPVIVLLHKDCQYCMPSFDVIQYWLMLEEGRNLPLKPGSLSIRGGCRYVYIGTGKGVRVGEGLWGGIEF